MAAGEGVPKLVCVSDLGSGEVCISFGPTNKQFGIVLNALF